MDKQATNTMVDPVTDDQELANVLAGMNGGQAVASAAADDTQATDSAEPDSTVQDEQTRAPEAAEPTLEQLEQNAAETPEPSPMPAEPATPSFAMPEPSVSDQPVSINPELASLKKDVVAELRPLVDKLDLPADERFDTLLLIIRSTDDQSLLSAAHDTAKAIDDDTKRAQALLDVIKEIDYFSSPR